MLSERVQAGEGEGGGGGGGIKAKLAARFKKRSEDSPEKKVGARVASALAAVRGQQ